MDREVKNNSQVDVQFSDEDPEEYLKRQCTIWTGLSKALVQNYQDNNKSVCQKSDDQNKNLPDDIYLRDSLAKGKKPQRKMTQSSTNIKWSCSNATPQSLEQSHSQESQQQNIVKNSLNIQLRHKISNTQDCLNNNEGHQTTVQQAQSLNHWKGYHDIKNVHGENIQNQPQKKPIKNTQKNQKMVANQRKNKNENSRSKNLQHVDLEMNIANKHGQQIFTESPKKLEIQYLVLQCDKNSPKANFISQQSSPDIKQSQVYPKKPFLTKQSLSDQPPIYVVQPKPRLAQTQHPVNSQLFPTHPHKNIRSSNRTIEDKLFSNSNYTEYLKPHIVQVEKVEQYQKIQRQEESSNQRHSRVLIRDSHYSQRVIMSGVKKTDRKRQQKKGSHGEVCNCVIM